MADRNANLNLIAWFRNEFKFGHPRYKFKTEILDNEIHSQNPHVVRCSHPADNNRTHKNRRFYLAHSLIFAM